MSRLHRILLAGALLVCVPGVRADPAQTWTVKGTTYTGVRVREATPATVTIFHSGGITQLRLEDLPEALRQQLGYDPATAAAWEQERQQERSAAAAARVVDMQRKVAALRQSRPIAPSDISRKVVFREEVDLRAYYIEAGLFIKDQGRRPSCSVFAITGALEYEQFRRTGAAERLSEEFLIWATHQLHPGIPMDTGYNFPEVISALQAYGVPPLELAPNTRTRLISDMRPTPAALEEAKARSRVVPVWFRYNDPQLVSQIVDILNRQKPVIVGVRWPSWRTLNRTHTLRDQPPEPNASHAVTLIGYRNPTGLPEDTTFIFRNSYGYEWGLGGCGLMGAGFLQRNALGAFFLVTP